MEERSPPFRDKSHLETKLPPDFNPLSPYVAVEFCGEGGGSVGGRLVSSAKRRKRNRGLSGSLVLSEVT